MVDGNVRESCHGKKKELIMYYVEEKKLKNEVKRKK
jgi:hypothetical protein